MTQEPVSQDLASKGVGSRIIQAAVGSSGFRLINIGLSFVVSILLTRTLGVEGYGIYAYSMSWVLLLNILGSLGSRGLIVREVATNRTRQQWGLIRGLLQWSNTLILLTSVATAVVFGLIMFGFQMPATPQTGQALMIALLLVPIMSMTVLRQSTMQGLGHILQGQLPESLLQPACFIIFLAAAYFLNLGELQAPWVMVLRVMSDAVAFGVGGWLLYRIIPSVVRQAKPEYQTEKWVPSMLSLLFIAGTGIVYTRSDTVMLGMLSGPGAVGLYAIALRGANFVLMSQQIGSNVLGPHVAGMYANGDIERLQQLTTKSIRVVMAYALPVALIFILLGSWFLSIFGPEFVEARNVLTILCLSKLINAATGPVGLLLTMTHHERDNAIVVSAGAVLNVGLNFLLIPLYGAEGAAIATGVTAVIANVCLAIIVYKRLGINCTILSW